MPQCTLFIGARCDPVCNHTSTKSVAKKAEKIRAIPNVNRAIFRLCSNTQAPAAVQTATQPKSAENGRKSVLPNTKSGGATVASTVAVTRSRMLFCFSADSGRSAKPRIRNPDIIYASIHKSRNSIPRPSPILSRIKGFFGSEKVNIKPESENAADTVAVRLICRNLSPRNKLISFFFKKNHLIYRLFQVYEVIYFIITTIIC